MHTLKFLLLPLCLLILSPAASGEETGTPDQAADKELDMQGLWVVKDEDEGMEHFRMGMEVESLRISEDGTKYLVEIIGGRPGQYRTLAIREGDQLKIGMLLLGNIIFSDDGKRGSPVAQDRGSRHHRQCRQVRL